LSPGNEEGIADLGLLGDLAGSWSGRRFNLIARPDQKNGSALFLEFGLHTEDILSSWPHVSVATLQKTFG
jgi:hypothetical protein